MGTTSAAISARSRDSRLRGAGVAQLKIVLPPSDAIASVLLSQLRSMMALKLCGPDMLNLVVLELTVAVLGLLFLVFAALLLVKFGLVYVLWMEKQQA